MADTDFVLRLIGGFELRRDGEVLDVPSSVHRLLGFLALNDRPMPRCYVAEQLWPETKEGQAFGNLRTALWRLQSVHDGLVAATPSALRLTRDVSVDIQKLHRAARTFRQTGVLPGAESLLEIHGELLPGYWDPWLVLDRERLRQEALLLLEASVRALLEEGDTHVATLLALGAVACDPLRESANVLAIKAFLESHDVAGAVRWAKQYTRLLEVELTVPPPAPVAELLGVYSCTTPAVATLP